MEHMVISWYTVIGIFLIFPIMITFFGKTMIRSAKINLCHQVLEDDSEGEISKFIRKYNQQTMARFHRFWLFLPLVLIGYGIIIAITAWSIAHDLVDLRRELDKAHIAWLNWLIFVEITLPLSYLYLRWLKKRTLG